MDTGRLASEVSIHRADDDSMVRWSMSVQTYEVLPIQRNDRTLIGNGKVENGFVFYRLTSLSGLLSRMHIMAQSTEFLDGGQREVLVGVQPGHGSRLLVFADLLVDLCFVESYIGPGVH